MKKKCTQFNSKLVNLGAGPMLNMQEWDKDRTSIKLFSFPHECFGQSSLFQRIKSSNVSMLNSTQFKQNFMYFYTMYYASK